MPTPQHSQLRASLAATAEVNCDLHPRAERHHSLARCHAPRTSGYSAASRLCTSTLARSWLALRPRSSSSCARACGARSFGTFNLAVGLHGAAVSGASSGRVHGHAPWWAALLAGGPWPPHWPAAGMAGIQAHSTLPSSLHLCMPQAKDRAMSTECPCPLAPANKRDAPSAPTCVAGWQHRSLRAPTCQAGGRACGPSLHTGQQAGTGEMAARAKQGSVGWRWLGRHAPAPRHPQPFERTCVRACTQAGRRQHMATCEQHTRK